MQSLIDHFRDVRGLEPARHQQQVMFGIQGAFERLIEKPSDFIGFDALNINTPISSGKTSMAITLASWILKNSNLNVGFFVPIVAYESVKYIEDSIYSDLGVKELDRLKIIPPFMSLMGSRFDVIIFDQIENYSCSDHGNRRKIQEWVFDIAVLRASLKCFCVNFQSRIDNQDMTAKIEENFAAKTISIPALNEDGESYWEEKCNPDFLAWQKEKLELEKFNAWYQQNTSYDELPLADDSLTDIHGRI